MLCYRSGFLIDLDINIQGREVGKAVLSILANATRGNINLDWGKVGKAVIAILANASRSNFNLNSGKIGKAIRAILANADRLHDHRGLLRGRIIRGARP